MKCRSPGVTDRLSSNPVFIRFRRRLFPAERLGNDRIFLRSSFIYFCRCKRNDIYRNRGHTDGSSDRKCSFVIWMVGFEDDHQVEITVFCGCTFGHRTENYRLRIKIIGNFSTMVSISSSNITGMKTVHHDKPYANRPYFQDGADDQFLGVSCSPMILSTAARNSSRLVLSKDPPAAMR